ncbi:MAG: hypothetical protein MUF49_21465 [Oculatellaceae cyanobacterium Prado106]|jgi:hypothetical protein|nr:hypothetical protein [Oculatellaceae cyanobacterium Prado106]
MKPLSNSSPQSIRLDLTLPGDHPEILRGLDLWLQLGLLSDRQVRQLGRQYLSCAVPVLATVPVDTAPTPPIPQTDFDRPSEPILAPQPSRLAQALTALMAEISVVWLLFLGVFMVVVSSGVLAASQWQNFSNVGQYAILWGYTIAFGLAGLWAGGRSNLQLTGRMLQLATLLLIPMNFWMMDAVGLWGSGLGVGIGAIATLSLAGFLFKLLRSSPRVHSWHHLGLSMLHWGWGVPGVAIAAVYVGIVGTAVLQVKPWSKNLADISQSNGSQLDGSQLDGSQLDGSQLNRSESNVAQSDVRKPGLSPQFLPLAGAMLLLLGRALLVEGIPILDLGLALGICGGLLCWVNRHRQLPLWTQAGASLLVVSWGALMTAGLDSTGLRWQAFGVGLLILGLLGDRLHRRWQRWDVLGLIWVGLATFFLSGTLVPIDLANVLSQISQWMNLELQPWVFTGLAAFPFVILLVLFSQYLRWKQKPQLALMSDRHALTFGVLFSLASAFSPISQTLYFTVSTLTLLGVYKQRQHPGAGLIYLTHLTGLLAVGSAIAWRFPNLSLYAWAVVFLGGMVGEWGFAGRYYRAKEAPTPVSSATPHVDDLGQTQSLHPGKPSQIIAELPSEPLHLWARSAWHMGLGLALCSYGLMLLHFSQLEGTVGYRSLVWLMVPGVLTGLASRSYFATALSASQISVGALLASPLLLSSRAVLLFLFPITGMVPGTAEGWAVEIPLVVNLAIATLLMLGNTQKLQNLAAAVITVGFGLGTVAAVLTSVNQLSTLGIALLWSAIALWLLWLLWDFCRRKEPELWQKYAIALEGWSVGLALLNLSAFTTALLPQDGATSPTAIPLSMLVAIAITLTATIFRCYRQPQDGVGYAIAWGTGLLVAGLNAQLGGTWESLALVILALALGSQLLGDRVLRRSEGLPNAFSVVCTWTSLHGVPILYAALGFSLAHRSLTATTGLYTLATALTCIGVGRRQPAAKLLTYVGIAGFSVAIYEGLVYRLMMSASGGAIGDGITLLALPAAAIAILYQGGDRWLLPYWRIQRSELQAITTLHWLGGSLLLGVAGFTSLSSVGQWLWIGTAVMLSGHALGQGRWQAKGEREKGKGEGDLDSSIHPSIHPSTHPPVHPSTAIWIYLGITQAIAALLLMGLQFFPAAVFWGWGGAIACPMAFLMYRFPWENWGWPKQPWQKAAMVLPMVVVLVTMNAIATPSLFVVAAFYARIAAESQQIRIGYLGLVLADWAIFRVLAERAIVHPFWYAAVISVSMLIVVELDQALRSNSQRKNRHLLRCFAVGVSSFSALYQMDVSWMQGVLAIGFSLALILTGIRLRVRAFLYMGTVTFLFNVVRQFWLFIDSYSFALWALGILLGLLLIWVAATFEARRSQAIALMQHWTAELEEWE